MYSFRVQLAIAALAVAASCLGGCAVTAPIQPTSSGKSAFDGAVYKGTTVTVSPGTPGSETFRVFNQGATGFVSMSSVRAAAEQRATEFCGRKGKQMESVTETTANPPYILGNFPRIEIVFDCIAKPVPLESSTGSDPKYTRLVDLKKLLDGGVITQAEFEKEKAKYLANPESGLGYVRLLTGSP